MKLTSATKWLIAATLSLPALSACSSVSTQVIADPTAPLDDGVPYYLPKRPIHITITVPATAAAQNGNGGGAPAPTITVDTVDPVPDRSRTFLLTYTQPRNLLGENHAKVGVTSAGLLTSVGGNTQSGIIAIVQNVAKSLGSSVGLATAAANPAAPAAATTKPPCQGSGPKSEVIFLDDLRTALPKDLCGYKISITNIDGSPLLPPPIPVPTAPAQQKTGDSPRLADTVSPHSGVFYRQDAPYRVTIADPTTGIGSDFLAYAPDWSPIAFAPLQKTFFANNNTMLTFANGALTGVDADVNGELVALSELPADFISAYTSALGGIFGQIGTNLSNQATVLKNSNAVTQTQIQRGVCTQAIVANEPAISPAALAGKTSADLATALTALATAWASIKSVCTS